MRSPMIGHPDNDDEPWPKENHLPIASDLFFTIPFDAPPVPASPSPEQLAFLESNKSRLSNSHHSTRRESTSYVIRDPPLSPKQSRPATLFERRRPERRQPQLSLPNIWSAKTGLKPARPSFASSRDTSVSVRSNFRHQRTSSLPSTCQDEDLPTPGTSLWSAEIIRRKSSIAESLLSEHGLLMENDQSKNHGEDTSSPEFEYKIHDERKIGNIRLCDVLRTLFASNGYLIVPF